MQGDSTIPINPSVLQDVNSTRVSKGLIITGGDGGGGGSSDGKAVSIDETDRMSYGANRWPRQETLALLKIRSDMDSVFRDSSLKGPLWEEVSRKLAELGYNRTAKKCKEKFENVYKYHKRTKDGRTGKSEGKSYRFFDQLEAFETTHQTPPPQPVKPPQVTIPAAPTATTTTLPWSNPPNVTHVTVSSTTNHHVNIPSQNNIVITQNNSEPTLSPVPLSSSQPINHSHHHQIFPTSFQNLTSHLFSSSTSSSTASDEELQGSRKRKRRWKDFFERLTKDVIKKQEDLQKKFLETVEKREYDRIAREEAWRIQEMARINREHEILIQERTTAAAKDAAVIAFLQKISGQQNSIQIPELPQPSPLPTINPSAAPPLAITQPTVPPPQPQRQAVLTPVTVAQPRPSLPAVQSTPVMKFDIQKKQNGQNNNNNASIPSPSRWPKVEVEALIRLRKDMEAKYEENGPKGPLWEEISAGMQRLGYNRNAKRCKEKWENINKYFKKVKDSNKKRSDDSKTCPYFNQLDALYKEKSKNNSNDGNSLSSGHVNSIGSTEPLMVRPEQQWPPQQGNIMQNNNNGGKEIFTDQNIEEDDDLEEEDLEDEGETEEEDEGGGGFQVVASKPPPSERQ